MAFSSYTDLQATIAMYLKRNNLAAQIPVFIALAEARFNRLFNNLPQQRTVYTITPTQNTFALPGDYNMMSNVFYGTKRLDFISDELVNPANEQRPNYQYSILGEKFALQTLLDGSVLSMHYFAAIEGLGTSNPSNWLLEDGPDIYLYGALLEAAPFLENDERIGTWQALLQHACDDIIENARVSQLGGGKLSIKRS